MDGFNKLDHRTASAMHRMQSPEMRPVLEFMARQLEQCKKTLIHVDTGRLGRVQGTADYLDQFLEAVRTSAEVAEKLKDK